MGDYRVNYPDISDNVVTDFDTKKNTEMRRDDDLRA